LKETNWLIANLLYGSGLRLMETLRLRIQDIDFDYNQIIVRSGKGEKDRKTMLPFISSFFCYSPIREWIRYKNSAGIIGS